MSKKSIDIKQTFTNPTFLKVLEKLEAHVTSKTNSDGDIILSDSNGNWIHLVNLCTFESRVIGIVGYRNGDEHPDGAAFRYDKDYGANLTGMAAHVFGLQVLGFE